MFVVLLIYVLVVVYDMCSWWCMICARGVAVFNTYSDK